MPLSQKYLNLLTAAESFCSSFIEKKPLETLLSHFHPAEAEAKEHGDPAIAPFLGRVFKHTEGIEEYFKLLEKYLTYKNMGFDNYFVDEEKGMVSVNGVARFTWSSTGVSWWESFTYVLSLKEAEDGSGYKITKYHIWADTASLYLASIGTEPKKVTPFEARG